MRALKMDSPARVRQALVKVGNGLLRGEIEARVAGAFVNVANSILSSLRIDDYEKKLAELELKLIGMGVLRNER